jgi:hypothetical protein
MKYSVVPAIVFAAALVLAGCTSERMARHEQRRYHPVDSLDLMSYGDVIDLSRAGVSDDNIIKMITNSGTAFRLRTDDAIMLADSGVSDKVIGAMLKTDEPGRREEEGSSYPRGPYYGYYGYNGYPFWYPWSFSFYRPFWGHVYSRPYRGFAHYGWYHSPGIRSGVTSGIRRRR